MYRLFILAAICAGILFVSPRVLVAQAKQPDDQPPNKVSLCHKTGSQSNPFIFLTISQNALKNGHAGHPEDILNVSSPEDCLVQEENNSTAGTTQTVTPIPVDPIITPVPSATPEPSTTPSITPIYEATSICHYTGDPTTPYEFVQVSDDETYQLHANHTGDIFDVTTADDCPTKLQKFSLDSSFKAVAKH
jgi:hypothetical protein